MSSYSMPSCAWLISRIKTVGGWCDVCSRVQTLDVAIRTVGFASYAKDKLYKTIGYALVLGNAVSHRAKRTCNNTFDQCVHHAGKFKALF